MVLAGGLCTIRDYDVSSDRRGDRAQQRGAAALLLGEGIITRRAARQCAAAASSGTCIPMCATHLSANASLSAWSTG